MILETARIACDWFQHPEHGVNALIPSTPRDDGDVEPPTIQTFLDFTRDDDAVLMQPVDDSKLPALQMRVRFADRFEPQTPTPIAECTAELFVRVTTADHEPARAHQDQLYTLRACLRSFRRLFLNEHAAARTRNQVQLYHAETLELMQLLMDPRDANLSFVFHAQILARDLLPT